MAVKTHVSLGYASKMIIMAILCLIFGLWGVYDYLYTIPNRHLRYDLFRSTELTRDALTAKPTEPDYQEKQEAAIEYLDVTLPRFSKSLKIEEGMPAEEALEKIKAQKDKPEVLGLVAASAFRAALVQPRTAGGELSPAQKSAYQISEELFNQLSANGTPAPPSKFDQPIQWAFILCLPFTPYFIWLFLKTRKRVYTLDDDGSLHLPDGRTWAESDVADVDMSRWMSKSIATLIHTDGERLALDDYLHKNTHLIVGHFAHKFAPNDWQEDAKMIRHDPDGDEGRADEADEADDEAAEPVESERV